MKLPKAKLATYFLSLALFAGVPNAVCALENGPLLCHEMAVETDAGLIHFEHLKRVELLPEMLQAVASVDSESNSFELANGSKWVASKIEMINGWAEGDRLLLSQNQAFFSTHRFALINMRLGKATPISLVREPRPTEGDTFFIKSIDFANDIITMNNGQQWVIYSYDHGTLRRFAEHDRLMLGVNTSDWCDHEKVMPYILIDTTTNQYVRATPLNR